MNDMSDSPYALRVAICHYKSEVKAKKEYAVPVLKGLILAEKQVEKYMEIQKFISIESEDK